jgi:hypothetical protein
MNAVGIPLYLPTEASHWKVYLPPSRIVVHPRCRSLRRDIPIFRWEPIVIRMPKHINICSLIPEFYNISPFSWQYDQSKCLVF